MTIPKGKSGTQKPRSTNKPTVTKTTAKKKSPEPDKPGRSTTQRANGQNRASTTQVADSSRPKVKPDDKSTDKVKGKIQSVQYRDHFDFGTPSPSPASTQASQHRPSSSTTQPVSGQNKTQKGVLETVSDTLNIPEAHAQVLVPDPIFLARTGGGDVGGHTLYDVLTGSSKSDSEANTQATPSQVESSDSDAVNEARDSEYIVDPETGAVVNRKTPLATVDDITAEKNRLQKEYNALYNQAPGDLDKNRFNKFVDDYKNAVEDFNQKALSTSQAINDAFDSGSVPENLSSAYELTKAGYSLTNTISGAINNFLPEINEEANPDYSTTNPEYLALEKSFEQRGPAWFNIKRRWELLQDLVQAKSDQGDPRVDKIISDFNFNRVDFDSKWSGYLSAWNSAGPFQEVTAG